LQERDALFQRAVQLHQKGLFQEAGTVYRQILVDCPDYSDAVHLYGLLHHQLGDSETAASMIHRAIDLHPNAGVYHKNLSYVLWQSRKPEQALVPARRALVLEPDDVENNLNLGNIYKDLGQLDAAVKVYRQALDRSPDHLSILNGLGNALRDMGRLDAAEGVYLHALAIKPDNPAALFQLGLIRLARGDYEAGWPLFEWRKLIPELASHLPDLPQPLWRGEELTEGSILLYSEQGFGDTIHFLRFIPQVKGFGHVIAAIQPELAELVKYAMPDIEWVRRDTVFPPCGRHNSFMSLAGIFRADVKTISTPAYLSVPTSSEKKWRDLVQDGNKIRIGLVWQGSPTHKMDYRRSIPKVDLAPFWQLQGVCFYSLQIGSHAGSPAPGVVDLSGHIQDFTDTAGAIARMDLLISVDTAVAHLAGAMGHPVWTLIQHPPEWRWREEGERTSWYPSMKLFRMGFDEQWREVISRVVLALQDHFPMLTTIAADDITARHDYGMELLDSGRLPEAVEQFQLVTELNPNLSTPWNNLGVAMRRQGKNAQAIDFFKKALAIQPDFALSANNLGLCFLNLHRYDEAESAFRSALQSNPDLAEAHNNLGQLLLSNGDYVAGWEECEWRLKMLDYPLRNLDWPFWDGQPMGKRTLLIHVEQGLGDTLNFSRYLYKLLDQAEHIVFLVQTPLHRLMEHQFRNTKIRVITQQGFPIQFHGRMPLLSLPHHFKTAVDSIPGRIPYIEAIPEMVIDWRSTFSNGSFKVGLFWEGKSLHRHDISRRRSVSLELFSSLTELDNATFYSLQVGEPASQVSAAPEGMVLVDLGPQLTDFAETAAVLEHLDLIITIDTALAHLAGAMGKRVWVLLPFAPDWRWGMTGSHTPWYSSSSLTLFRQKKPGDWLEVMERIHLELVKQLNKDNQPPL
jgi:tetratricopeptide (TPR) repeat protein